MQCYKICRCITFPDGLSIHGSLAVVPQSNGERRSQARTDTCYNIPKLPLMKTEQNLSGNIDPVEITANVTDAAKDATDVDDNAECKKKVKEKRDSTISFRVSRSQREKITDLADECGMNLSDYVLSRAYGYEPKIRLTPKQEAIREQLVIARSDYAKYTSMLNTMSQDERRAMFHNQPWMIDTLRLLGKTADRITRLIKKYFAPNRIPVVKIETVQETISETDKKEEPT